MGTDLQKLTITGSLIKTARLTDEWYCDAENPANLIEQLKKDRAREQLKADLFTFWQRFPEVNPKYHYFMEWESVAALPVKDYRSWWEQQIDSKVRNMVRKAAKKGVKVRVVEYTDEFVEGMAKIFNESPIRQGKPFWHFGKDFETVKREFARNIFREDLIGAYYMNELIGFIVLADAGRFAMTRQILGSLHHRDKSPVNALLAKAVQICEERRFSHLIYASWVDGTLGDFKRHNGFQKVDLPRYYIPLTLKGELALRGHLHHGIKGLLPVQVVNGIKALRHHYYDKRGWLYKTTCGQSSR